MHSAGARAVREHDQEDMSREAVLLQWERKIEAAERRPSRYGREQEDAGTGGTVSQLRPSEDATREEPRRFERRGGEQIAQPERLGLWAFLLGLFLMVVAAGSAHA